VNDSEIVSLQLFSAVTSLFGGYFQDRPEQHIAVNQTTTRTKVENELWTSSNVVVLLIEMKHTLPTEGKNMVMLLTDAVAQTIAELIC
jgi:hypothetical protein